MTKRNWYIEGKAILEIVSWWRTGYCSVGGCLNLLQHKAQKLQVKWLQLLGVRGFSIAFKCMPVTTLFIECYGADTCCLLYQWYTLWLWNQNFMIFLKSIRVSGRLVPTVFFFSFSYCFVHLKPRSQSVLDCVWQREWQWGHFHYYRVNVSNAYCILIDFWNVFKLPK